MGEVDKKMSEKYYLFGNIFLENVFTQILIYGSIYMKIRKGRCKSLLMEIKYKNAKIKKQCTDLKCARKDFNDIVANLLHSRINFIEQAKSLADIINNPSFHFHGLSGKEQGLYAIDLGRRIGFRLIIEPLNENEETLRKEKDIEVLKQCTKIVIVVEVTNHYE